MTWLDSKRITLLEARVGALEAADQPSRTQIIEKALLEAAGLQFKIEELPDGTHALLLDRNGVALTDVFFPTGSLQA